MHKYHVFENLKSKKMNIKSFEKIDITNKVARTFSLFLCWPTVTDFTLTLSRFSLKYDVVTCNFDNCENSCR